MARRRGIQTDVTWYTSLSCNAGQCVKVGASGQTVLIADSKTPNGPILKYSPDEWRAFLAGAKNGDFDNILR